MIFKRNNAGTIFLSHTAPPSNRNDLVSPETTLWHPNKFIESHFQTIFKKLEPPPPKKRKKKEEEEVSDGLTEKQETVTLSLGAWAATLTNLWMCANKT